jgi:hypothetical protein
VVLPDGLDGIDGFRVYVATARPGAATDVTVLAAGRDRTLRAFAPGVLALSLDQPLRGRTVDVAIEPVLEASAKRWEFLRAVPNPGGGGDSLQYRVRLKKSVPAENLLQSVRTGAGPQVTNVELAEAAR